MTELVLGTAQLGSGYGITNTAGRIGDDEARRMLTAAVDAGVRTFDTAAAYDDAEERLGRLMPAGADVGYITKFALADEVATAAALYGDSLSRLRVTRLRGVLAHGLEHVPVGRAREVVAILSDARQAGVVQDYGVSVYDVAELRRAVELLPGLGIVQLPGSVADRRLLDDPLLAELRASGVVVHVRSAFLQGLLLSDPSALPPRFAALAPVIAALDSAAADQGASRLAVLLAEVREHPQVDAVVVGATSEEEFAGIARAWTAAAPLGGILDALPVEIVDPRRWNDRS
jgi:aryl-alcohol dehydrogenase-like predicted oxidoreductase